MAAHTALNCRGRGGGDEAGSCNVRCLVSMLGGKAKLGSPCLLCLPSCLHVRLLAGELACQELYWLLALPSLAASQLVLPVLSSIGVSLEVL